MVTAIVSVMTGIPVRRDLAMTGEITLRGRVWPIAGLKAKLLAASRGGIKTVLIPEEDAKDLVEISDSIKSGLEIVPVSRMVLARAMTRKAGADRVGRDHDHCSGRARGDPGRGGSLDAHRAMNDRDTGAEGAVTREGRRSPGANR
jgi:ATP-dependent Lon protease